MSLDVSFTSGGAGFSEKSAPSPRTGYSPNRNGSPQRVHLSEDIVTHPAPDTRPNPPEDLSGKTNRKVDFQVDEDTNRIVIQILDGDTGKVIKQIPQEEFLRLTQRITDFNKRAFEEFA